MLRELVKMWSNHKVMVRGLSRFFHYLVYKEMRVKVRDVVIAINQECEGEQIDLALIKNVLVVEIGMGHMDCCVDDFETEMLAGIASYYSQKAASWIMEDCCPNYMPKECLKREKD
ncbi:hypothetical protein AMTRI_Chr07g28260 [Amborella trichopoda]